MVCRGFVRFGSDGRHAFSFSNNRTSKSASDVDEENFEQGKWWRSARMIVAMISCRLHLKLNAYTGASETHRGTGPPTRIIQNIDSVMTND